MLNHDVCWYCSRIRNNLPPNNSDGWMTFEEKWNQGCVFCVAGCPIRDDNGKKTYYGRYIEVTDDIPVNCLYVAEQVVSQPKSKQTHKPHGLTIKRLRELVAQGKSDAEIGKMYGLTYEGVAYHRRKNGINRTTLQDKMDIMGKVTIRDAANMMGLHESKLTRLVREAGLRGDRYALDTYRQVVLDQTAPDGLIAWHEVAYLIGKTEKWQAHEWLRKHGVKAVGKFGKLEYYSQSVIEKLLEANR